MTLAAPLRALAAALSLTLLAGPVARADAPATAPAEPPDDTAAARARFRAGTALYAARKYREAAAEFEAAYRLRPHGAIHYNVAQCRERLEEWPAALRAYADYLREVPDAKDRAAVRAAMARIEAKLAATGVQALLVYTDPPGAEVRLDGKLRGKTPFHIVLPPGDYALGLARDGSAPVERTVALAPDASLELDLVLPPAAIAAPAAPPSLTPPPEAADRTAPPADRLAGVPLPPPPQAARRAKGRLWTWVAAGAAVAAASAGVYYGLDARSAESSLHDGDGNARALARDAERSARTANVLYGVAGAAAAAGVTLFFVEGRF